MSTYSISISGAMHRGALQSNSRKPKKLNAQVATAVSTSLPSIATVAGDTEVQIRTTTEVINPAVHTQILLKTAVAPTFSPIATVAGDAEVSICATTEVVNPANLSPPPSPINFMCEEDIK